MGRIVATLKDLASATGVAFSTAFRWKSSGAPVEPDGTFDVDKVEAWRKRRTSDGRRRGPPTMEIKETVFEAPEDKRWAAEYRKAKALKEVMLLQELRGQLMETDKVERFLVARAFEFRKALLGLGRRLALVLQGRTAREIQAILDEETSKILEEYSREDGLPKPTRGGGGVGRS